MIVVTAKELTGRERDRLSAHVQTLLEKGRFTDLDLLHEMLNAVEVGD